MKGSPIEALAGIPQIVLAAGHGHNDPGACNGRYKESAQAVFIVDTMAYLLRRVPGMEEAVVVAPHQHDTHETIPWLNGRFRRGQAWALEIHRDSADTIREPAASGRCGIYHGASQMSTAIAGHVRAGMILAGAHESTWSRSHTESGHGSLGWIRQPQCISHLIECGFMEGRNDTAHLRELARIVATALAETFAGKVIR